MSPTPSQETSAARRWLSAVVDFFWANERPHVAQQLDEATFSDYALHLDRARAFLLAARQLADSRQFEPAWFNYQETARCLARCSSLLTTPASPSGAEAAPSQPPAWSAQHRHWESLLHSAEANPTAVARALARRSARADRLLETWLDRLQPRSPAERRAARAVRIATAVIALGILPLGYHAFRLYPQNLAVGRPVTVSSLEKGHPQGLVDDYYYGLPPFVTKRERRPSVTVDLGAPYWVSDARVMGRHDCCYGEGLPLVFEVSVEGKDFVQVGKLTDPFEPLVPWIVPNISKKVRYVRVRSDKVATLALTEIAVFGRR